MSKDSLKKWAVLVFILIANLWIWKMFSTNPIVAIATIFTTIALYLSVISNKRNFFILFAAAMAILLLIEWKTSSTNSLTYLNENEKMLLTERMHAYPPVGVNFAGRTLWIPAANWLEQRKEILVFYKLKANLSELVDPNLYFYANHPRERVGVIEYEKFPYILLPIFVVGIFAFRKKDIKSAILGLSPLVLNSIIGNSNPSGPFALFPIVAVTISLGTITVLPILIKKKLLIPAVIIFTLVFIQTISYAKY